MVAIAFPPSSPTTLPDRVRRHPLPSGGAGRGHRRSLYVVGPAPRMVLGRPLASVLVTAVLALAVLLAGAYLALTPAPAPGASAVDATTHVVADGETLWSIAVAHAPAGEAATYVEELVAANGTSRVVPGRSVVLPAP